MNRVQRHWGIWLLLLVAGVLVVLSLRPIFAASMTVKGHPILGSGTDSSYTNSPDWSGTGSITRVRTVTTNFSGDNVTSVTVSGTKFPRRSCIAVIMYVTVRGAGGSTLASGNTTIPASGTTFSRTVTLSTSVYYHNIATVDVSFTEIDACP